ncbi:MAG TPA: UDP-N-acetylmuramoyl-L-alanine--D-glutamate ligase [Candidatus Acidoferrales bacterium]|nr:UDP-N-acetylmuramoyl-L-alanine--D-glutamate ligase [Candidatus Acidoferrales bacterium]
MSSNTTGSFDATEKVLVIGLGRSGRASVAVLRRRGATVLATDEKPPGELEEIVVALEKQGVGFIPPGSIEDSIDDVTAAILSPGVPLNSELVRRVQAKRIPVFSEIEVAYRICKSPIVAISGTKGKTTTTALVGEIFRHAGHKTRVGGNIGDPLIEQTVDAGEDEWVIAEVSSFQLEAIRSFKPRISLLLNISPDHLDRYHSMDEYTEAKFRIFANQGPSDTFVGNLDDPRIATLAEGENAVRVHARALWFASAPHRNTTLYVRGEKTIMYAPPTGDPRPVEIMKIDEIPLRGAHNVENVMGAILSALAAGIEPALVREAVMAFEALPHRLELVGTIDGIDYVDDSKATNPGSVIAALRSFERPIVLIAGGKAKGTDFAELGKVISSRTKGAVLIGESADAIAATVKRSHVERASSMREAVEAAARLAKPGDVVLLSPGCASFDMFSSAEARGDEFDKIVAERSSKSEALSPT